VTETFLILLAGGIMLAAAVCDPEQVTLNWLRLCGILALVMAGLSWWFIADQWRGTYSHVRVALVANGIAILLQLGFAQLAWRRTQRVMACAAFFLAVTLGRDLLAHLAAEVGKHPTPFNLYAAAIGIAAMTGLALTDMLLGHAYLTASKMTISPFRRLNAFLAGTIVWRALLAGVATAAMSREIWLRDGLFVLTRWLVGLAVPTVFVYMAHDCIKRRSTQSATGILYVAGVLIFVGEIVALYLVRSTGLPF